MSIRMGLVVAVGLIAAFGFAGNAGAEMAAAKPKPQRFAGACVFKGTPEFCTMLQVQGKLFNVSGASPALPVGKRVTGWGNPTTDFSPCGGTVLNVVTFNIVGNCPTPKAKK
jgi:hypothetical protein